MILLRFRLDQTYRFGELKSKAGVSHDPRGESVATAAFWPGQLTFMNILIFGPPTNGEYCWRASRRKISRCTSPRSEPVIGFVFKGSIF
jgi:hypothetical protein